MKLPRISINDYPKNNREELDLGGRKKKRKLQWSKKKKKKEMSKAEEEKLEKPGERQKGKRRSISQTRNQ